MRDQSQLSIPLYSELTLRTYVATNELGGERTNFVPGGGKPEVSHRLGDVFISASVLHFDQKPLMPGQ